MYTALGPPYLKGMLQGLKHLAELDVVGRPTTDLAGHAIDAVRLVLKYLSWQVGVFDSDTRAFHGQSSPSATE